MDDKHPKIETFRALMRVLLPSLAGLAYIAVAVLLLGPWSLLALGLLVGMLWPDPEPSVIALIRASRQVPSDAARDPIDSELRELSRRLKDPGSDADP